MDLTTLIPEIDYQQTYTYEQRVDIFNKYLISPATKMMCPIWQLSQFIISNTMPNKNTYVYRFGHGQNLLNNSRDIAIQNRKEMQVSMTSSNKSIMIRSYDPDAKEMPKYGKYRNAIRFDLTMRTISLCTSLTQLGPYQVSRDLYDQIDQWLIDFGYSKW